MSATLNFNNSNLHIFSTQNPTQSTPEGDAHPLLSLPSEILNEITEYVATASISQSAATNAIQWRQVCALSYSMTHVPCIERIINSPRQPILDMALCVLWISIVRFRTDIPQEVAVERIRGRISSPNSARLIRGWMTDPNNAPLLGTIIHTIVPGSALKIIREELGVIPSEINTFRNLQWLFLNNNKITQIASRAFAGCMALRQLELNNNQITWISPQAFAGCWTLVKLILSNNKIPQITAQTFAECLALETLDLCNNQIAQIAPRTFAGCPALESLYLGGNKITQIAPQTFADCSALKFLDLEANQIVQIAFQAFADCSALRGLRLSYNPSLFQLGFPSLLDGEDHLKVDLEEFAAFSTYNCRSELATFYRAVSEDKLSMSEIVEHVKRLKDRNLIYEMVYREAVAAAYREGRTFSTDGDHSWGEHHVCDNMRIFCWALKTALREKFNRLSPEQKCAVHGRIYEIAREDAGLGPDAPAWDDPNWGENHREENALRFIDAMAGLTL